MPTLSTSTRFASRVPPEQTPYTEQILELVGSVPPSREAAHEDPASRSRIIASRASIATASLAGALSLPPGALGWLTIGPELVSVWRMQRQMVADIAGAYGRTDLLTREHMLYCLFGHTAAGAFRDIVIRAGERYLVRRAPLSALYAIANKIALRIAQRGASRIVTRWFPILGSVGIAGYVYLDTAKVADAAIAMCDAHELVDDGAWEEARRMTRRGRSALN